MNKNLFVKFGLPLLLILVLGTSYFFAPDNNDFKLTGTKGEFALEDHRGKVVILYFGYRNCPDICPTTLSTLSKMYRSLDQSIQSKVQVVFISVDVERDTIDRIAKYVSHFHPDFIGATGSKEKVRHVANIYGVKYEKYYPGGKKTGYYSVDHSVEALLLGPDGKFKEHIEHGEDIEVTKSKILKYLRSSI